MKGLKVGAAGLFVIVLVVSAYVLGGRNTTPPPEKLASEPRNLEEISKLESEFDRQQAELTNRLSEVQNRIKTTKLNLGLDETDNQVQSIEIAKRLEELNGSLLSMKTEETTASVPFPPDSPAGKLQNQPRTASGIPISVLQKYEQETGVSPDEIEELMRRTQ